jgi:hypothetical protein
MLPTKINYAHAINRMEMSTSCQSMHNMTRYLTVSGLQVALKFTFQHPLTDFVFEDNHQCHLTLILK